MISPSPRIRSFSGARWRRCPSPGRREGISKAHRSTPIGPDGRTRHRAEKVAETALYEIERTVEVVELAARTDVSASATSQRSRRATVTASNLIENALVIDDDQGEAP